MTVDAVNLSPGEAVPGREFTEPARSLHDLAALARIRASLVARVRSGLGAGTWQAAGESHWLAVPSLRALARSRPTFGVGFFGQSREHVDHGPIIELEHDLVDRPDPVPGLLAYYDVRFMTGQWGNLVLFAGADDAARLRSDPTHQAALRRAADHYHSVRLHRLCFPDGALGVAAPSLESTLLIDFSETPPWRAVRRSSAETAQPTPVGELTCSPPPR